jgi:hypothetical protein
MHGQFLIVQLEDEDEAVLGRITSISSQGRLAFLLVRTMAYELFQKIDQFQRISASSI